MKLAVLSHACLKVSSAGKVLLTDPWLVGSCYWRSWWNYPPVDPQIMDSLAPDAIYLTHIHWDHFHGPTLRKFSRDTTIIIPYERSRRLRRDLESFRFTNIVEIPHGGSYQLADDFRLTSYHFSYWGDSALVIESEGIALLNANDAKFMGLPLQQIIDRHERFDFAFRSHSSANDRICWKYTGENAEDISEDPETYTRSFFNFMEKVRPRYAVPFASNHCHLHRDVYHLNSFVQTPYDVKRFVDAQGGFSDTELRILVSGDSWSSESGFEIGDIDYFDGREERLESYRDAQSHALEKTYRREDIVRMRLSEMQRFFGGFFAAVPNILFRSMQDNPVVFRAIAGIHRDHFLVDPYRASVTEIREDELPSDPIIFETTALVLKHAMNKNMFSHIGISKRVAYRTSRENARHMNRLLTLLAAYEYEVLPLGKLLSLRTVRVYLRRWREILVYVQVLAALRRGVPMNEIESRLLGAGEIVDAATSKR